MPLNNFLSLVYEEMCKLTANARAYRTASSSLFCSVITFFAIGFSLYWIYLVSGRNNG